MTTLLIILFLAHYFLNEEKIIKKINKEEDES